MINSHELWLQMSIEGQKEMFRRAMENIPKGIRPGESIATTEAAEHATEQPHQSSAPSQDI